MVVHDFFHAGYLLVHIISKSVIVVTPSPSYIYIKMH